MIDPTSRLPELTRVRERGTAVWTDVGARSSGLVIAFSERGGGVSASPFGTLNLAGHVGDDPAAVDENRTRFMEVLGLSDLRDALVTADQVHGEQVSVVGTGDAGCGAFACGGAAPLAATDAILTTSPGVPLLLCFADCVPVVLTSPGPGAAVVHAGWRGALAGLPGTAVERLADEAGCAPRDILAYVGPHICARHYAVDDEILSQFVNRFGTFARAESGGLDLGRVVAASLIRAGVDPCNIACLGTCTAEATDRFFSYRAEAGLTGRHGALVCILSSCH